ncbi:MAG: PAS domain S-box protein [Cyanobacteriota bacterium]
MSDNMLPEATVNILVVNDQPRNLVALEAIIESLDQNLVKAHSGEEVFSYLLHQEFAVILLDVPRLADVLAMARRIREKPISKDTPIIWITGNHPSDTDVLSVYALGLVDYLLKPLVPEILFAKVSIFISLFKKTQAVKRQAAQLKVTNRELQRETRLRQQAEEKVGQLNKEKALQQRAERERLIAGSIQRIRETLDLDTILNTTVQEIRQFLACDRVLVYRVWSNGTGSTIAEALVPDYPSILGQTFPVEVFPLEYQQLYRQGRVRAVVDPSMDHVAPCLIEFLQHWGVKSKLVVPIVYQGELWGLLIAHHCCQSRQWQALELDLLEQFANQLAIAIQQADLYQKLQQELTERKQVEAALRQSEERLQLVIEAANDGIWDWDMVRQTVFWSDRIYEFLGLNPHTVTPTFELFFQLLHPDDRSKLEPTERNLLECNQPYQVEFRLQRADGSYGWFLDKCLVVRDERGRPIRLVGSMSDITECKRAQEELRQARDQLEIRVQERTVELTRINACLQAEICDRIAAEEALRTSEERFRVTLKNSPTTVFNQDIDLRYTWIHNPALSLKAEDCVGKLDSELFPPEEAQRLTSLKHRVLTMGLGTREDVFFTINGEVRYYDLTVEPLPGETGEIVGLTGAATDITQLRTREQQLRAVFEGSLDAIVIIDDKAKYVEANPAACELFGVPLSELLGKSISDFIDLEPAIDFELSWRKFVKCGQATGELLLYRPDGTVRNIEYAARASFLPGRHLSVLRDITMRKQAEEALRQSQRFIQQIADTTPSMIYIFELAQLRNIYLNRYGTEFFGSLHKEIQAKEQLFFTEVLHPDDGYKFTQLKKRLLKARDGKILETEFRMKNARGEWRWLQTWHVVFTRTGQGVPEQILGTAIDITAQKQAEEIRRALEAEQELRRFQLRFFSMVSHEFRTPLSIILGSAQLLKSYTQAWPEEKKHRNLYRIETAAKNLTQLLDDLLMINRAESGKLECNPQAIDLEQFGRRLLEDLQFHASSKHKITFSFCGQCPTANLDEKLMRSILTNLLSNAIKYSPQGGKIHLSLRCDRTQAIFRIKDQGIGIPLDDQSHLFELFHRGKNTENIPGTGLGLSVVKKCLDLQGGKISIKSQEGVGTTVTVTIPLNFDKHL